MSTEHQTPDSYGGPRSESAQAAATATRDSYYGRAIIKEPVWKWEIPTYFFTGGLAGASATLGLAAGLAANRPLARAAWTTAFAGVTVSPMLLTSDLGRPERFLNMFRMFKITSPMSVGSWLLGSSGAAFTAAFAREQLGRFPRLGLLAGGIGGAVLGPALTTYTAVLLADTAVPAWHEARRELPFVFAGSAMAAAGGAACILTPADHAAPARRLAVAGASLELIAAKRMERGLGALVGSPYREGRGGRLSIAARSLAIAGSGMIRRFGKRRAGAIAGGTLLLAGSCCERFAVFHAGLQSAQDPRATVEPQRERRSRRAFAS